MMLKKLFQYGISMPSKLLLSSQGSTQNKSNKRIMAFIILIETAIRFWVISIHPTSQLYHIQLSLEFTSRSPYELILLGDSLKNVNK